MMATMATPTDGVPRRFLRTFLLLSLDAHGTSYGYELCETVQRRGLAVDLAGVYRGLRSMQQHDLVTSTWAPSENGPDRRLYSLTDEGRSAAAGAASELQALRDALNEAMASFGIEAGPAVRSGS